MKLRDFIAEALIEIQQGVAVAIDRRDKEGLAGRISPIFRDPEKPSLDWTKLIEKVEFDVAVTEASWPAPGSEDTKFGVTMGREVGHGETEVHARVQA